MNHRLRIAFLAAICTLSGVLAACSTRTEVSLTGNTPVQYSHVWMTVQEVWFNSSATAGPEDGGWAKFPLSKPSTVDLVAQNGGNLDRIASSLHIPAGTYSQVRLIPVDASAALAASAQNAGALYNFEADYVDSKNATQQVPLELLNPDKGIGIQTDIKVRVGNSTPSLTGASATTTGALPFGSASGSANSPFGSTSGMSNNPFGSATGTTSNSTSTGNTTSSGTTSNTTSNSFAVTFDGGTDLVPFSFATGRSAILLSAHGAAYDLSLAGGISGQLILTNITTSTSGLPNIRVSAESLSADGTRHVIVSATAVQSDGSFLLYPLATNSSTTNPLTYDVVIHGPGIATIIVKSVQVPRSSTTSGSTTSSTTSTNTGTGGTASGTGASNSSTTTLSTNANVNPVSIGTLTPRADPDSYPANITTALGAPLPAGAMVNFHQTLGGQDEVPYVIESSPIDPFNQMLFNPPTLSSTTVDSGTWSTNGKVTIVSASPAEGDGIYKVAAVAPGYSDGALNPKTVVSKPSSGTAPATVELPALKLGAGATAGSVAANVIATVPGKYDQGELLLSHDGALVAAASLDAVLSQGTGGIVTVANLPSGTPNAVYYATVRAWKSTDPAGSAVQRQWYPQAIDLRTSTSSSITLPVN